MADDASRRFKILYVDTDQVWRGGQEQLLDLMKGMRARGHSVFLAAPENSELFHRALGTRIPARNFRQRQELSLPALLSIWKLLKETDSDIVHANTPRPLMAVGLASRLAHTPAVFCSRRVDFPLRSRLSAFKYNWFIDRVLTISSSIEETLSSAGVKRSIIEVVYEGVDLDWIDDQQTLPLNRPDKGLVIGTVAHMSPEKGHTDLLDAIGILKSSFPRIHLLIVGDGELRDALKERTRRLAIEDLVTFAGFRSDSEAVMKQFDIFCLPSLSEGLSSAILAAMANRLPVVSTSVGGIPELVSDGVTGSLVPPGDPESLAAALETLLKDSQLRNRMGEAGRSRVAQHFTVQQKLDATENAYRELLLAKRIS